MGQNSSVVLNLGAGGPSIATYQDSATPTPLQWQKILLATQTGTADPVLINLSNSLPVQGAAAALTAASGNPQQMGGVFNTVAPTVGNGQICPIQLDANGNVN